MIRGTLSPAIRDALDALADEMAFAIAPPSVIDLERPARREHGDWSNVAMATAKSLGSIGLTTGLDLLGVSAPESM